MFDLLSMSEIIKPGVALPSGSVDFTTIMTDIINSPSHINRPGRNTTIVQRNANFYGCGSVCIAGIKHNNVNAKDDSHVPVSFFLLPAGFAAQARAASHVAAVHFSGSTWEELIAALVKHYAPKDYFVNGGRAPLLYNSLRYFEASLDLCRAANRAVGETASWCLRLLVTETGWFFEREDTHMGKPSFISRAETPDRFADEICSLLAVYPGVVSPGCGKSSRQAPPPTRNLFAPLQGHCGHGCGVHGAHHECIVCMTMRVRCISPRMFEQSVASDLPSIRPTRATRTHRNRVPHSPDICLFRQACHNPILRDRATKHTPAELLQQYFEKGETVSFPSCPLVDMPLANSTWVLPKGDEDWLAKGFHTELYTLPLDGSGVPGPTFSFKTLDEVGPGLTRCDLPLNWAAAGHRIARYALPGGDRLSSLDPSSLGLFEGEALDPFTGRYTHSGPQGFGSKLKAPHGPSPAVGAGPVPLLEKLSAVSALDSYGPYKVKRARGGDAAKPTPSAMTIDTTGAVMSGAETQPPSPASPDSRGEEDRAKKARHVDMVEAVGEVVTKVDKWRLEQASLPKPTAITRTSPSFPGDRVAKYLDRVQQQQVAPSAE